MLRIHQYQFECLPKGYRKLFELKTYDIKEKLIFKNTLWKIFLTKKERTGYMVGEIQL
mgnify:CR=1 FL=1